MRVLHICNDYSGSKVHANLYRHLDSLVDRQVVYTYVDGKEKIGKNSFEGEHTKIVYDDILDPWIRKIYPLKEWWVTRNLVRHIDPQDFDIIYATTLFSDGGVALRLHKKYGLPYMVAVRTTDLGTYLNHGKFLWKYGREVLLNASRIILINKVFSKKLESQEFSRDIWPHIKNKVIIRPNGIDSFWIENLRHEQPENSHTICYVGAFNNNKNVLRLIEAVKSLKAGFPDLQLTLVGGGGEQEELIRAQAEQNPWIHILGPIHDKKKLLEVYRQNSIFAMVSKSETFGLVYLEALSQNLRLLYSKGQGIDGMFENVGEAVDAQSVEDIAKGLRRLLENYDKYDCNYGIDFSHYDWSNIAKEYSQIIDTIIDK